jgi:hypothetical protein
MSRGPGKIDRIIAALFAAEPDNAFMLHELLGHVYPDVEYYEKKHRVAVLRAAKRHRISLRDAAKFKAGSWSSSPRTTCSRVQCRT